MNIGQPAFGLLAPNSDFLIALLLHGAVVGSLGEAEVVVGDTGRHGHGLALLLLLLPGLSGRGGLHATIQFPARAVGAVQVGID